MELPHLTQYNIEFLPKKDEFDRSTTLKVTNSEFLCCRIRDKA